MTKTFMALALTAVLAASGSAMFGSFPATAPTAQDDRARDPVCNLIVIKNPDLSLRYGATVYYFCMKADMEAFRRAPERYLRNSRRPA